MKHDLTERYIYAVTKRMSARVREDVSMELRSLIDDMLTERCGEREPAEKDIRVVLTELGSPQELYAKYDEDAGKSLIGQPYYSTYKFVLRIILACAAFGLTLAAVIRQIMNPAFASSMAQLFEGDARFLTEMFGNFNLFLMGVMLLALVMDTLEAILKMERK